jgi:hypothetical protein
MKKSLIALAVMAAAGAASAQSSVTLSQNSLRYVTPNLSGFTGQVTYSFNPYGSERAVTATTPRGGATQLGLNYDQGPLAVRFSYYRHTATGGTVATTGENAATGTAASQRAWTIGAGYDFGIAKVGLTYDRSELRDLTAAAGPSVAGVGTAQRTTWILPVTVPLGTGQLIGTYARAGNVKLGVGGTPPVPAPSCSRWATTTPCPSARRWAWCTPSSTTTPPACTSSIRTTPWATPVWPPSAPAPTRAWCTWACVTSSDPEPGQPGFDRKKLEV